VCCLSLVLVVDLCFSPLHHFIFFQEILKYFSNSMLARNIAIIQVNESNNLKCFRKGNVSANVSANKY
jgi:hypothetical protein